MQPKHAYLEWRIMIPWVVAWHAAEIWCKSQIRWKEDKRFWYYPLQDYFTQIILWNPAFHNFLVKFGNRLKSNMDSELCYASDDTISYMQLHRKTIQAVTYCIKREGNICHFQSHATSVWRIWSTTLFITYDVACFSYRMGKEIHSHF